MPLNFKDADILTHAIHSRLQLVADKVIFRDDWDGADGYIYFVEKNSDLLKTIGKSINSTHRAIVSVEPHMYEAAKMFMFTRGWTGELKHSQQA
jgi:hypothetical protein